MKNDWIKRALQDLADLREMEALADAAVEQWKENARRQKEKTGEEEGFAE